MSASASNLRNAVRGLFSSHRAHEWVWALPPIVGALLVMSQGLSNSRLFFDRDLSFFYWPEHLWLRRSLLSGDLPLWDPYVAFGQSAIADPVRQILFFPTLPIRLLLPPVLGFNFLVLLPILLAGLGAFFFFRRRRSLVGASFAASIFSLGGPVVSTANSLNLSWSLALMPWVLCAADDLARAPSWRAVAGWSLLQGIQILAGEPLTATVTAAVALAYVVFAAQGPERQSLSKRLGLALTAVALGGLLVAVQLLPLFEATSRSARAQQELGELLALHPLALAEVVAWPLFGERFPPAGEPNLWLRALNGGYLPLFTSMYLGLGAVALAVLGAWASRRDPWCRFWVALGFVATIMALGRYTPVYPALQTLLPTLSAVRYPAKYFLPVVLAIAALAGLGWDYLRKQNRISIRPAIPALVFVVLSGIVILLVNGLEDVALRLAGTIAGTLHLADPDGAAPVLVAGAGGAALRLFVLGAMVSALIAIPGWRYRSVLLFAVCFVDPLVVNTVVNPTLNAELLSEPPWVSATREYPEDRVYVGGRINWWTGMRDIDNVPRKKETSHARVSEEALMAAYQTMFASFPSAWGFREGVSLDLTALWPYDYTRFILRFARAPRGERTRLLGRVGTRYFLTNEPPNESARAILRLAGYPPMALYEVTDSQPRVAIARRARVEPNSDKHFEQLFSDTFDPGEEVLLFRDPPPPAGAATSPQPAGAVILSESADHMEIQTHLAADGGYLVIWDSFDAGWVATVDGQVAPLVPGNAFFRVVRLSPGDHRVRLVYRPQSLVRGAIVSLAVVFGIVTAFLISWRRGRVSTNVAETP